MSELDQPLRSYSLDCTPNLQFLKRQTYVSCGFSTKEFYEQFHNFTMNISYLSFLPNICKNKTSSCKKIGFENYLVVVCGHLPPDIANCSYQLAVQWTYINSQPFLLYRSLICIHLLLLFNNVFLEG